ncbi:hypothetical protein MNBD_GAMMA26-535 [hydrothermal vent metagenome]|uniref:NrfJ n=1 Tax=hydrothermal vent metagenome TaxID=652676 RepID=A0A3B1BA75_9ZZZZ
MKRMIFALSLCAMASTILAVTPPGHLPTGATDQTQQSAVALPNIGKVLEVMDTSGYLYLNVEDQGNARWIAGNKIQVLEGDVVRYSEGNIMRNFHSKSLNRTFPYILFTAEIRLEGAHPSGASSTGGQATVPAGSVQEGQVLSAMDSGGYSYIEVTQDGQVIWLAAPKTSVTKGDTVRYGGGTVMKDFFSKTLEREFLELIFLGGIEVVGK